MAIHMEKDPTPGGGGDKNKGNQGGGGLGGLTKFLPMVLFFLFKKPKLTIGLLIVAGAWYMMTGGDFSSLLGGGGTVADDGTNPLFMGCDMSEEVYNEAMVYEPLAAGNGNQLPSKTSLLAYTPKRLNQGRQGSCVGWSSAYGARSILQARATGQNPNEVEFSPSFLYNQIALPGCQGAYIYEAMESMHKTGGLLLDNFSYDETSCSRKPSSNEISAAQNFRTKGYSRLSMDHDKYKVNPLAVKQNLAQGAPVVIGMLVGGTFMSNMRNKEVWEPSYSDYAKSGFGGHAMCVIGYDDNKSGGAFQIMNSWGESWGKDGIGWVKYADFEEFVREAYGLYPMGSHEDVVDGKMKIGFGLVDYQKQAFLPLRSVSGNVFRTVAKVSAGDRFKVQVSNNMECYTYIFNQEADGVSNVLFPYTDKHSPYCGITGVRLFPKDYSLVPDAVGNRDRIAVVITKTELNYNDIKAKINSSRKTSFEAKVAEALGSQLATNVTFKAGEYITFEGELKDKNAVAMIIEVEK